MNSSSGPRVLILTASTGGGHGSAALALSEAMELETRGKAAVCIDDVLTPGNGVLSHLRAVYALVTGRMPAVWARLFYATNCRGGVQFLEAVERRLLLPMLRRRIEEVRPHLIVSVHPLLTHAAVVAACETTVRPPVACLVTDPHTAHRVWFTSGLDMLAVAGEGVAAAAAAAGVPWEKTAVCSLPLRRQFEPGTGAPRATAPGELPLVLLMGGAEGVGRIEAIVEAVSSARLPCRLAVVCGNNERLRRRLQSRRFAVRVEAYGFVEDMAALMRQAEALVTKAGPSTLAEAVACGVPVIISNFLPGQEEGNVEFMSRAGLAVLRPTPEAVCEELRAWLTGETDLPGSMRFRARDYTAPDAARSLARLLLALAEERDARLRAVAAK